MIQGNISWRKRTIGDGLCVNHVVPGREHVPDNGTVDVVDLEDLTCRSCVRGAIEATANILACYCIA